MIDENEDKDQMSRRKCSEKENNRREGWGLGAGVADRDKMDSGVIGIGAYSA